MAWIRFLRTSNAISVFRVSTSSTGLRTIQVNTNGD